VDAAFSLSALPPAPIGAVLLKTLTSLIAICDSPILFLPIPGEGEPAIPFLNLACIPSYLPIPAVATIKGGFMTLNYMVIKKSYWVAWLNFWPKGVTGKTPCLMQPLPTLSLQKLPHKVNWYLHPSSQDCSLFLDMNASPHNTWFPLALGTEREIYTLHLP